MIRSEQVSVGTTPVRLDAPNDKQSLAFKTASGQVAVVDDNTKTFAQGYPVGTEGIVYDIESAEAIWVVAASGTVTVYVTRTGVHS